jgi:hypothetical protein
MVKEEGRPIRNKGSGGGGEQGGGNDVVKEGKVSKNNFPFTQFKTGITRSIKKKT